MTAWALSSATSGRRTSISSYRRMRQDTPSNGKRPADGGRTDGPTGGAEPKGNAGSVAPRPIPTLLDRFVERLRGGRRCILSAIGRAVNPLARPVQPQPVRGGLVPASTI